MSTDSEFAKGDKVRHRRTNATGTVMTVGSDGLLMVKQDKGPIGQWPGNEVEKIEEEDSSE
jgi:hypothetical protein